MRNAKSEKRRGLEAKGQENKKRERRGDSDERRLLGAAREEGASRSGQSGVCRDAEGRGISHGIVIPYPRKRTKGT